MSKKLVLFILSCSINFFKEPWSDYSVQGFQEVHVEKRRQETHEFPWDEGLVSSETRAQPPRITHVHSCSELTQPSIPHATNYTRLGEWGSETWASWGLRSLKGNNNWRKVGRKTKGKTGNNGEAGRTGKSIFVFLKLVLPVWQKCNISRKAFQVLKEGWFMKIYSFPSVKLLAESADWPQQRIPHRCSLIVFCKQNACCLVTFHLSLTFPESYCYQIRFTLSSCDYCNLLNPGVHPSGEGGSWLCKSRAQLARFITVYGGGGALSQMTGTLAHGHGRLLLFAPATPFQIY